MRRKKSGIARKLKGGNSKSHLPDATVEVFQGRAATASAAEEARPPPKKAKQHYDKQRCTASKLERSEEKAKNLEGKVKEYKKHEGDLLHLLQKEQARVVELESGVSRSRERLHKREQRYADSLNKKEEERKTLKRRHTSASDANKEEKEIVKEKGKAEVAAVKKQAEEEKAVLKKKVQEKVASSKQKGKATLARSQKQCALARTKLKVG